MGDLSPHFSTSEMACHHCGRCSVSGELLNALEQLRALGPEPIDVDDACRCAVHNATVGGVPNSEHVFKDADLSSTPPRFAVPCIAADIRIVGLTLQQQYDRAKQVPAFEQGGIGVYDGGFIHVDVRKARARWARKNGVYLGLEVLVIP